MQIKFLQNNKYVFAVLGAFVFLSIPYISIAQNTVGSSGTAITPTTTSASTNTTTITPVAGRFVVPLNTTVDQIIQSLVDQGYIKEADKTTFSSLITTKKIVIVPGAYKLTADMTIDKVVKILGAKPYMKWVVIPEGLRKEEIAEILSTNLGWTKAQKTKWVSVYTKLKYDYVEGVYFPDTYLIPVAETPQAVANRLIAKFNEKFKPYLPQFNANNTQWTKGLTLASIVQREASSDADMSLIAGILLNRLNQKQPLYVDATLQYVRGDKGHGWWAPISVSDKKLDSPYNTYKHAGLPPHPISNPGLPAIEAVLHPTVTDCLYYLHDHDHVTHCAVTYEEHQANIAKYLK